MKIMVSGPITSWEIDGETVETVSDFMFWGSKITTDGDCSHEIKRHLLLGRKVMTNLDSIFKSRDITLPTKVRLVKAMAFPVVVYGCESWTVKKAEHQRIDAFELWCWRSHCLPKWLLHFAFSPTMRVPIAPHPCQHFVLSVLWILVTLIGMQTYLVLIFIYRMAHDMEHLFICLFRILYILDNIHL